MSIPLPSPFLSPVLSPFSLDSNNRDPLSEHFGTPRKHEKAKGLVRTLTSPFASPVPSPGYTHPEDGGPSSPTIHLSPEIEPAPSLHKRGSVNSLKGIMKSISSPFSSPSSSPFPSPDKSGLSPNHHSNLSSPEIDPSASPPRKRERVKSFVKGIRRTSSQLFKRDKKDGDATPRNSTSTISTLVSETLSVSTAATTPSILRRFSHSKLSSTASTTSVTTTESDLSASYLEVKVGEGGCMHSPIVEVATPVSPAVVQPLDSVPTNSLETCNEEDMCSDTGSEHPDPLQFPLPPSPIPSPPPTIDPVDPFQPPVNPQEQEVDASLGDDKPISSDDTPVSLSSPDVQPPAVEDIALMIPSPDRTAQPSPALPSPSTSVPGPDSDEGDVEMRDLSVSFAPPIFLPIPNFRFSYFFRPVLTWWLSKGVLSYPYLYS